MGDKKNIEEFLDPDIQGSLKRLGLVPPQSVDDYIKLEQELKQTPIKKPTKLKDPMTFLEREPKVKRSAYPFDKVKAYQQNLAQAAREGKLIPDHIRQKMKQDKQNSKKSNGK